MPGHKLRLQWIAAGLCGTCGKPRGAKGTKTMCRKHADEHSRKQSESNARKTKDRRAKGLCLGCGEERLDERKRPRAPEEKYCWQCEEKKRQKDKRYYAGLSAR